MNLNKRTYEYDEEIAVNPADDIYLHVDKPGFIKAKKIKFLTIYNDIKTRLTGFFIHTINGETADGNGAITLTAADVGAVSSVNSGEGINVDNTDAANPIVNNIDHQITLDTISGTTKEVLTISLVEDGGSWYIELEQEGGGDVTCNIGGSWYTMNCTTGAGTDGKARSENALTLGTATVASIQYFWMNQTAGNVEVYVGSAITRDKAFGVLGVYRLFDSAYTIAKGYHYYQRFNNASNHGIEGRSLLVEIAERVRVIGLYIYRGMQGGALITPNPSALDSVHLSLSAGVVYQLHQQYVDPQVPPNEYYVVNDPVTPYKVINDLNELTVDANGDPMHVNNRYYGLDFTVSKSSENGPLRIYVFLPSGTYSSQADAISDVNKYISVAMPIEESGSVVRICRMVLGYTNPGSGTITNILGGSGVQDNRNDPIGTSGGGGAGSSGGISSVVAGDGIDVDNADPLNPAVSVDATVARDTDLLAKLDKDFEGYANTSSILDADHLLITENTLTDLPLNITGAQFKSELEALYLAKTTTVGGNSLVGGNYKTTPYSIGNSLSFDANLRFALIAENIATNSPYDFEAYMYLPSDNNLDVFLRASIRKRANNEVYVTSSREGDILEANFRLLVTKGASDNVNIYLAYQDCYGIVRAFRPTGTDVTELQIVNKDTSIVGSVVYSSASDGYNANYLCGDVSLNNVINASSLGTDSTGKIISNDNFSGTHSFPSGNTSLTITQAEMNLTSGQTYEVIVTTPFAGATSSLDIWYITKQDNGTIAINVQLVNQVFDLVISGSSLILSKDSASVIEAGIMIQKYGRGV